MGVWIALGIVAAMRAALVYGEGAELASRPLVWRSPRLPRFLSHAGRGQMSHP